MNETGEAQDGRPAKAAGRGGGSRPVGGSTAAQRLAALLPWAGLAVAVLYFASGLRPPREPGFQLGLLGRLPIVDLGRTKPLDTFARTTLLVVSGRQAVYLSADAGTAADATAADGTSDRSEARGHAKVSALHWLLDVMAKPEQARGYRVVRVEHPDIKSLLGVDQKRKYFSVQEIVTQSQVLEEQFQRAQDVPANDRTPFQRAVLELAQRLNLYFNAEDVTHLLLVPPDDEKDTEGWLSFAQSQHQTEAHGRTAPAADTYIAVMRAWRDNDPASLNAAVASYLRGLEGQLPGLTQKIWFETVFNRMAPFLRALGMYVVVFLLAALSWLRASRALVRTALWVLAATLVVHTLGLAARIFIHGRPPVTNLNSSAIFVGWGAAVLGLVLERFYRNGIGAVTAAGAGFLTLLVAHNLSLDGDTMTMMQAVLDTNIWLATHVVVITLGYASTFLAGFLGIVFVLRGLFTRSLSADEQRNLTRMIYGIVCFATLFSFVGTILGGIWADQSWGRFWGWDPKENGALLIVLWNVLILHARWGGMVRQRGLAVLAVAGNIVTGWSWFGTNMLGVGLHAYGWIDSALFWMAVFVTSQLGLIGLGCVPLRYWRSMQPQGSGTTPAASPGGERRRPAPAGTTEALSPAARPSH